MSFEHDYSVANIGVARDCEWLARTLPMFEGLDKPLLEALLDEFDWVAIQGGTTLFEAVEQWPLFQLRKRFHDPTHARLRNGCFSSAEGAMTHGEMTLHVMMVENCQPEVFEVIGTRHTSGCFTRGLNRRKQQSH